MDSDGPVGSRIHTMNLLLGTATTSGHVDEEGFGDAHSRK